MSARVVDEVATEDARQRHRQGTEYLNALFAWDAESAYNAWLTKRRSYSAVERASRRKIGKAQKIARRRNRA